MEFKKNRLNTFIGGMVVLVVGILTFCYWSQKKEIWFCDEVYSYESANGFEQAWPATFVDEWMSGKDVEKFFAADSEQLSLREIAVRLYSDHVPLYFWIFRMVALWGFHGSGTIWIGLSINLLFYIVILCIMYWLFWKVMKTSLGAVFMVVASSVINRLMMEQAMTLRMYMMLLLEELLLLLAAVWIMKEKDGGKLSVGGFAILFISSLAGFLTHYDFWIFYAATAGIFCGWMFLKALKSKQFFRGTEFKAMLAWVINFGVSLLLTIAIFPYCRWNLNRGKGEMALQSLFVFSEKKIANILWGYERQSIAVLGETLPVTVGLLLIFGCIIGGMIVLYCRKEYKKLTYLVLIFLVCQVYQLVVCFTFPAAREERYLWGTFSIMVWLMCYGVYLLTCCLRDAAKEHEKGEWLARIGIIIWGLGFVLIQISVIDSGRGIAYLFNEEKDMSILESYSDVPWIVYGNVMDAYSYYDILIPEEICFLTEENTQKDVEAIKKMSATNQFILYTTEAYQEQAAAFFEETMEKEIVTKEVLRSVNLKAYLVTME